MVTLPKVTSVDQVEAMVHVAETLDLRFEVQVETPQSILGPEARPWWPGWCTRAGTG